MQVTQIRGCTCQATSNITSNYSIVRLCRDVRLQEEISACVAITVTYQFLSRSQIVNSKNSALLQAHVLLGQLCLVTSKQVLMLSDRVTKPGSCHGWDGSQQEDA